MINTTITLPMGGKDRTLLFGVNGSFNYIEEASKKDPIVWINELQSKETGDDSGMLKVLTKDVAVFAYAGLNSYLDSLDQDNIPFDKVKKWCNAISIENSTFILKAGLDGFKNPEPGELTPTTAQANGNL